MPRFSNIKDTLIEINNMSLQAGTRYRESGLVRWPNPVLPVEFVNDCFREIAW